MMGNVGVMCTLITSAWISFSQGFVCTVLYVYANMHKHVQTQTLQIRSKHRGGNHCDVLKLSAELILQKVSEL